MVLFKKTPIEFLYTSKHRTCFGSSASIVCPHSLFLFILVVDNHAQVRTLQPTTAMESQGPTVTAVAIIFAVVTVIAILLRLWARIFLVKKVGADDGE